MARRSTVPTRPAAPVIAMATDTDLLERTESTGPIDSTDEARDVIEATMETVGERITDGQAEDLAESLPDVAAEPLLSARPGEAEEFSLAEFLERVDERTERPETDDPVEPVERIRAALTGVRDVADETELERTRDQLPGEFDLVFEPGEPMDDAAFVDAVEDELEAAGLETVDPQEATAATLETLADRITGGEAGTLATYLPREVRTPLTGTEEDASQFDREEFLERIASGADVDAEEASAVARAVFAAVEESAAEDALERVRTQLPAEYDPLFGGDARDDR